MSSSSRLAEFSTELLMQAVRYQLSFADACVVTLFGIKSLLSYVKTPEATFLIDLLNTAELSLPSSNLLIDEIRPHLTKFKANQCAKYYIATYCFDRSDEETINLFVESAKSGFMPAIRALYYTYDDDSWLDKIPKYDPVALFNDSSDDDATLCLAAENGSLEAIRELSYNHPVYFGRYCFLAGHMDYALPDNWRSFMYTIGREIEGYEVIWGKKIYVSKSLRKCIRHYKEKRVELRRAALTTVFILSLHIGRDVARLIGRLVDRGRP